MGLSLNTQEDIVGVDVRDGCVTASQLSVRGGRVSVSRVGWVEYEEDADDAGLAVAMKRLWKRFGFDTYTVCASLRNNALTLKQFRFPTLEASEVESALRLEAEEALQVPQNDLLVDCHVNRVVRGKNGNGDSGIEGILVAATAKAVTRQVGILEDAGLYPVIMDVSCMALGNLFHLLKPDRLGEVVCLVNLSVHSADIVVLGDDGTIYPRTVISRASQWKDATDYLVTNIQDSLKYYEFKLRRVPVQHLVFTGHVPSKDQVLSRVSSAINLPVEFWCPLEELSNRPPRVNRMLAANKDVGPLLSTSMGLALRR